MIALWVIEHFPRHHLYVEPYGGGASVLLRKMRSKGEIYNDLDAVLVQLFRVLRDPAQAAELVRRLELTPYARDEFKAAYEPTDDPVELARRTIVRSFMGFGGDGTTGQYTTGFRANITSNLKFPAQEWATYPYAIRTIIDRMKDVTIENGDAIALMRRVDGPGTLHYVDPPYLPSTRSKGNRRRGAGYHVYSHELSEDDHAELLDVLLELDGMVVLSGYPSKLYDETLIGWERVERRAFADGGRPRIEVLYINPAATDARRHGRRPRRKPEHAGPLFNMGEDDDGNNYV
jgi:DNA adenine methylase